MDPALSLGDHVARRTDPHLVSAGLIVPEILRGSEPRFEDMVRYMEFGV